MGMPPRFRSKRVMGVLLAAMIGFCSLGTVAPAAIAVEPNTESVYELNINGQLTTMAEGETAVFGMSSIAVPSAPGTVRPLVDYPGNSGTITITTVGGVYYWNVKMTIPVTSFLGTFSITDLTSGFSGGSVVATSFSGSAPTSKLRGHRYSGTLSGKAFFAGVPVSTTGPNNTIYQY
ncbi:hypothetical protein [Cryobacterium sp. SO1]|uniref:hypothetical protein n=1 Tax=Cryobacterium sp. SO1 TaxID=1897061 RepID=UPI001023105C|nr:hypothetical protein [Cryobacterium sp. SO1]RZI35947.1 hypothetical protein BJQ95_01754 [Cryobacterium sp. SO1]